MRRILIAIFLTTTFLTPAARAASPEALVAGVRAAADDPARPLPPSVADLSYAEALALADKIGQTAIIHLIEQQRAGRRDLPGGFLSAIRFKAPGHFTNRPSGDR